AGIMGNGPATWTRGGEEQSLSWFEAKGILEEAFRLLHIAVEYQSDSENPLLHPGRTASLRLGGDRLGTFGQVHPQVRQERSLPEEVYMFQLSAGVLLSAIEGGEHRDRKFLPYSTFPSADRDIAFFVPLEVSVRDIQQAIAKVGGEVLESIQLFDEYRGEAVPEGQRSLAFRSIYRAGDRTLTDAEIDPIQQKIRDVLVKNFEASLRS
ncbi:MAG: phenylalanine--tRNA ligase subunit beta, partial [Okeania sp. SIO2H7]|nr:phenylalanine--tRNA ligase subunit beta [Okeania sp. SIO2H7]